jgi:hypothetical protein
MLKRVIEGKRFTIKKNLLAGMKLWTCIKAIWDGNHKPLHLQRAVLGERVPKKHLQRLGLKGSLPARVT